MFLECQQSESVVFDDGYLRSAKVDSMQGSGLRFIASEAAGYLHASEISEDAIKRAVDTVKAVHPRVNGAACDAPQGINRLLHIEENPLQMVPFAQTVNTAYPMRLLSKPGHIGQKSVNLA